MPLVTQKAPDFTANAVLGSNEIVDNFNLYDNIGENGAVIFFYPLDFTFVCPSELIAFDHRYQEFKKRGIEVIAVSIDSHFTHLAWKNTPVAEGGIGKVQYPMVADLDKSICKNFDVLLDAGIALRGSFLLDKDGTIRHAVINDLPLGRNIDEMVRMVDTMQFTNEHGEVCPAGWQQGDEGMKDTPDGVAEYLGKNADKL
ncbi:MAG: peroxiredoxin [Campylobacterales bacterium]|nr:peroxiredoxin [Campylobacterales bacterium]